MYSREGVGEFPDSQKEQLRKLIQAENKMSLVESEDDDWLVINEDSNVRTGSGYWLHQNRSQYPPPNGRGQPAMLGKSPRDWMNLRNQGAGYVGKSAGGSSMMPRGPMMPPAPSFADNTANNAAMGPFVRPPPQRNGWSSNSGVGFNGMRAQCRSSPVHVISIDSDPEDEDEYSDEDDDINFSGNVGDEMAAAKFKHVSSSNGQRNWDRQELTATPNSWGNRGFGPVPDKHRTGSPPDAMHHAQRPADFRGPVVPPRPPFKYEGNGTARDIKEEYYNKYGKIVSKMNPYDVGDISKNGYSDDYVDGVKAVARNKGSHQLQHPNLGRVGAGPPLGIHNNTGPWSASHSQIRPTANGVKNQSAMFGMEKMTEHPLIPPSNLKHSYNPAAGVNSSQKKANGGVGRKETCSRPSFDSIENAFTDDIPPEVGREFEALMQKFTQIPHLRSWVLSAADKVESEIIGRRNSRKEEIMSETDPSHFDDDDEESNRDDDDEFDEPIPCSGNKVAKDVWVSRGADKSSRHVGGKSAKKMDVNCVVKQMAKLPEDKSEEEQCCKHQKTHEATDDCAGEQLQLEIEKAAEQSHTHASLFEDFKHRATEVAKFIKFHIAQKHENDACAAEREKLMKIHEEKLDMKKRHLEEEQELEKQFAAALSNFLEKQIAVDSNTDTSGKL